jgi:alkylhydroperoxidase family enzyme
MCRYLNIDDETINQVLQKSSDLNPKRVKISIDFAVKMATNSALVTEQDHQNLLDSGLSKNQVFELMSLASVVNYSNTLAQGMMLVVDEDFANLLRDNVVI